MRVGFESGVRVSCWLLILHGNSQAVLQGMQKALQQLLMWWAMDAGTCRSQESCMIWQEQRVPQVRMSRWIWFLLPKETCAVLDGWRHHIYCGLRYLLL
jgi:hypothetical protein